MSVTLRYFDCRGRAQPMRFFLAHHNLAFIDERVPFTDDWHAWASMKANRKLSGPFAKLPVLEWQGQVLTQTNLIANFLQQEIAPAADRHIVSATQSCLAEDIGQLYLLLNLDLFAPGADIHGFSARTLDSLDSSLDGYENLLSAGEKPFGSQGKWSIAAFWLLELWQLAHTLYAHRMSALLKERQVLASVLADICAECERLSAEAPPPTFWSARPDEVQRLAAVQKEISVKKPTEPV